MKKQIAGVLAATMLTTLTPTVALASNFSDMPSDWSKAALEAAVNNGLLKGDNGKIMPNAFLTRAQLAAMVNRAFGTSGMASLSDFVDVPTTAWYYNDMAKAVKMQTFMGSDNRLNPDNYITREEAFVVLARAFKMADPNGDALYSFSDSSSVSSWARSGISALISAGYISGSNGKINPKQNITRAEFAQIMDNLVKTYVQNTDTYSKDTKGNVMVNVPGAVLKNMTITGNLIIGDGVGSGDVTLENVVVNGTTIVRGGGVNSIRITGSSNIKNIVVVRIDGEVRVFAEDGTQVGTVVVDGKDDVIIEGKIGEVKVEATDVTVTAKNATIGSAVLTGDQSKLVANEKSSINSIVVNARRGEIVAEKGSSIKEVVANQDGVKVSGDGTVKEVSANANDIVVSTPSTSVSAARGTSGVMAGKNKVEGGSKASSDGSSYSGGGRGDRNTSSKESLTSIGSISGTAKVGVELVAGTVSPTNATVSYQWQICNTVSGTYTNISGATSSRYTPVPSDAGKFIKVSATGTGNYSGTVVSAATAAVQANPILATASTITVGQVDPTVVVTLTNDTFTANATDIKDSWTGDQGTTGLLGGTVTKNNDKQITFQLTGTAKAGIMTLQAKSAALTSGVASNTITIVVGVAPALAGVTIADDDASNDKTKITMPSLPSGATKFLYKVSSDANAVQTYLGADWTANANNVLTASQANLITVDNGKNIGIAAVNAQNQVVQFVNKVAVTLPTYKGVTGITGVPTTGTAGTEINLTGATAAPTDATNKVIVWTVKSAGTTGVATSDLATGKFTPATAGTLELTATITNGATATTNYTQDFTINVAAPYKGVTGITGVPTTGTAGTEINLTGATVAPTDATNKVIVWTVKSAGTTGVATSDLATGKFTPATAGTLELTATITNGATATTNYTQDFTINVAAPYKGVTGITGVPTTGTVNQPLTLTGTVAPSDATNKAIVWTVKSGAATIANGTELTATGAGNVVVTAKITNGLTANSDYTEDFTIAFSLITDATLKASSIVKGKVLDALGTPSANIASVEAGTVLLLSAQATDNSNAGSFITSFDKTNAGATVKVVKYAESDTAPTEGEFNTATPFEPTEIIANGDYFIIKVTAADNTTVLYYKVVVTVQ